MPTIILETFIYAPADICFDLMRDIRIHEQTTSQTSEKAVAGITVGKVGLGQRVTFEGRHFGVRQRFTVEVVEFDRPRLFVDEMTHGAFSAFRHVHEFFDQDGGTLMRDTLRWTSPLGILGKIADRLLIERHMTQLVRTRNIRLKEIAESKSLIDQRKTSHLSATDRL
jgi:ligand-binding SRPBCC domain-containing protein